MRIVYPDNYNEFECAAGKCPDTCCKGWQIEIDDKSLEKYERHIGHFSDRLQESIDWNEGCFKHDDSGRCALLNKDNLCEMVLNMGEDSLCPTCALYPRHVEEYEGLREWSLSMSCPVAAAMILGKKDPVHFVEERNDDDDPLIKEFGDFDFLLFTELEDARQVIYAMIQDREMPIGARINALMQMSLQLQICVEENRISNMKDIVNVYAGVNDVAIDGKKKVIESGEEYEDILDYGDSLSKLNIEDPRKRYEFLQETFSVFSKLECMREGWQEIVDAERDMLSKGVENYVRLRRGFKEHMLNKEWWPILEENFLMAFVYTYFCGAVYDDWIDTKLMLGVFSLVYTEEFIMNLYYKDSENSALNDAEEDDGDDDVKIFREVEAHETTDVTFEDCVGIVYRYVREIEHSDNNLNTLEEFLHEYLFSPA